MSDSRSNHSRTLPIGRQRSSLQLDLPLTAAMKVRLERAPTRALIRGHSSYATLRHAVAAATADLRAKGIADDDTRAGLTLLIEDVARHNRVDRVSLISGVPRWRELATVAEEWIS